jgi:hypothetical protein
MAHCKVLHSGLAHKYLTSQKKNLARTNTPAYLAAAKADKEKQFSNIDQKLKLDFVGGRKLNETVSPVTIPSCKHNASFRHVSLIKA